MSRLYTHEPFCFAGQPAPCPGYFLTDDLPCVCGAGGTVLEALSQVEVPALPLADLTPAPMMLALSA